MSTPPAPPPHRHHDSGQWLVVFIGRILVVCPRCGGRAVVLPRPGLPETRNHVELMCHPRRMTCAGCGVAADWAQVCQDKAWSPVGLGGGVDPFFCLPLWLRTRCAGEVLWACNEDHVAELTGYVGATLRERTAIRSNRSMLSRLPRWVKLVRNRAEVLAALERLRVLAGRSSPQDRSDAVELPTPPRGRARGGGRR